MSIERLFRFFGHAEFKKYFFNTGWMFATQGVRLVLGLFVGLALARYFGPELYGSYSYVILIVSVVSSLVRFGTEDQLVRDIILDEKSIANQLNDAFILRLSLALCSIAGIGIFMIFSEENQTLLYVFLCSFGVIFQSIEVIDLYYRAKVQVKVSSIFRIFQILLSSGLKILMIFMGMEIEWFFYLFIFDCATYSIPLYILYCRKQADFVFLCPDLKRIRKLAVISFPLMVSTTAAILFTKLDQMLIAELLGAKAAGYYIAASKIVELASLVPSMILMSVYTAILNSKNSDRELYRHRFESASRLLIALSLVCSLFLYYLSPQIIKIAYSSTYAESADILMHFSILLIPITIMFINLKWFVSEGKNGIVMYKTICAMILNLILCIILVPRFQYAGGIWSSFVAYIFSFYIVDIFFKETREAFYITNSFFDLKRRNK